MKNERKDIKNKEKNKRNKYDKKINNLALWIIKTPKWTPEQTVHTHIKYTHVKLRMHKINK